MSTSRLVGIGIAIFGIVLLIVGIIATDSIADRFSSFFTGKFTESTVWFILGGTALVIAGSALAITSADRSR